MFVKLLHNAALSTVRIMDLLNISSKRKLGSLGRELVQVFGLSKKDAKAAEGMLTAVSVKAGRELAWEGSGVKQLVFLLDGEITVTRGGEHLATLGAGEVLGEITALGIQREQTASAVASKDSRIAVAGSSDISKLWTSSGLLDMLQGKAASRTACVETI